MNAGPMVMLVTLGTVVLVAVVAGLVTLRRFQLTRAQTRRARELLAAYSEEWSAVTAGAPGRGTADRSRKRQRGRSVLRPWWRAGSSPRHALPATAHHQERAS